MARRSCLILILCLVTLSGCSRGTDEIVAYSEDLTKDYSRAIYRLDAVTGDITDKVETINATNTIKVNNKLFDFSVVIPTLSFTEFTDFEVIANEIGKTQRVLEIDRKRNGEYYLKTEIWEKSPITKSTNYFSHSYICLYDETHDWLKTTVEISDGRQGLFETTSIWNEENKTREFIAQNTNERLYAKYEYEYMEDICIGRRLTSFYQSVTAETYTEKDTIFNMLSEICESPEEWAFKKTNEGLRYNGTELISLETNKINGELEQKVLYE